MILTKYITNYKNIFIFCVACSILLIISLNCKSWTISTFVSVSEYEHLLLVSHSVVLGHRSRLVHGVDLAHPVGLRTLARQPDVLTEICWEVEGEMVDRREGDGLDFVLQGLS